MGDSQKLRTVRIFLLIRTEQIKFFENHGVQMQLRGVGEKQGAIFSGLQKGSSKNEELANTGGFCVPGKGERFFLYRMDKGDFLLVDTEIGDRRSHGLKQGEQFFSVRFCSQENVLHFQGDGGILQEDHILEKFKNRLHPLLFSVKAEKI